MTDVRRFSVGAGPELVLRLEGGRVAVAVGASDEIVLSVDGNFDDWDIGQVGGTVDARPARRGRVRSSRVSATVPPGCRVEVRTASADVRLDGELGVARLTTASGDMYVEAVSSLHVATASGDLQVGRVGGEAELSTGSGDVRGDEVDGSVTATTAAGDVRLGRVAGDLVFSSVSGDLRLDAFEGDDLVVKTVSGDVDVALPSGIRVSPEIKTLSGSMFLPEKRTAPDPAAAKRRVRVAFKSVSGDLRIRRLDD